MKEFRSRNFLLNPQDPEYDDEYDEELAERDWANAVEADIYERRLSEACI